MRQDLFQLVEFRPLTYTDDILKKELFEKAIEDEQGQKFEEEMQKIVLPKFGNQQKRSHQSRSRHNSISKPHTF